MVGELWRRGGWRLVETEDRRLGRFQGVRSGFGLTRRQAQFKDKGPNLNLIAVRKDLFADKPLAVDERAVCTAEIAQLHGGLGNPQHAVLPANPGAVRPDVALAPAAKNEFAAREAQGLALWLASDHHQIDIHRESLTFAILCSSRQARRP